VALFIFHGASRDEQAGVKSKPSPAVAKLTALLKRAMRKRRRVEPAANPPPAKQPPADAAPAKVPAGGTFTSVEEIASDVDYFGRPGDLPGDGHDKMDGIAAPDEDDDVFVVHPETNDEAPSRMP
jgi:hypothetical protein